MTAKLSGRESGQTLVELVLIAPVVAVVISGLLWLLGELNRRTECTRLVFEGVRARLENGRSWEFTVAGGRLQERNDGIEGRLKCGRHTEVLFLPQIGKRKPGVSPSHSSF